MSKRIIGSVAACALVASCAPDAWNSYRASGFNDYLDVVGAQCQPLWIGQRQLQQLSPMYADSWPGGFDQFMDLTSRLYYNRLAPAPYRTAVQQLAGSTSDPRTNRSIDCIIAKLPADRPSKPPGGYL